MPSPPLDSTKGRMTSGVACHLHLWAAHTVELRRAWHAFIAFGKHKRSNHVGRGMPTSRLGSTHGRQCRALHASIAFGQHTRSKDVKRGMTSPPLDSAHGRTTSGATCHHRLWKAHTVERRRTWHAIITFGQHTRLNYVGRGMPSSRLGSTIGRTTSGVACQHRLWEAHTVERHRA